jgi:hypothetical protein
MSKKADSIFDDHILPKRGYHKNDLNKIIECNVLLESLKEQNKKLEENTNLNKKIIAQRKAVNQTLRKSISELTDLKKYVSRQKFENEKQLIELRKLKESQKQQQDSFDAKNADLLEKSELMNKLEKSLNSTREDLNKREKHIEAREAYGKQNLASKSDINNNFTEFKNEITETLFMASDDIIKAINAPQKKKLTKEKSNHNQIDFLSDKQSISLPEDYVFFLQDGEDLGECTNIEEFFEQGKRLRLQGEDLNDFLANFRFYFLESDGTFLELFINQLSETCENELIQILNQ